MGVGGGGVGEGRGGEVLNYLQSSCEEILYPATPQAFFPSLPPLNYLLSLLSSQPLSLSLSLSAILPSVSYFSFFLLFCSLLFCCVPVPLSSLNTVPFFFTFPFPICCITSLVHDLHRLYYYCAFSSLSLLTIFDRLSSLQFSLIHFFSSICCHIFFPSLSPIRQLPTAFFLFSICTHSPRPAHRSTLTSSTPAVPEMGS